MALSLLWRVQAFDTQKPEVNFRLSATAKPHGRKLLVPIILVSPAPRKCGVKGAGMIWLEWVSLVADGITIGKVLQKMRQWSVKQYVGLAVVGISVVALLIGVVRGAMFSEPETTPVPLPAAPAPLALAPPPSAQVELPPLVIPAPALQEEPSPRHSRLSPVCRQPQGGNSSLYLPSRQRLCRG